MRLEFRLKHKYQGRVIVTASGHKIDSGFVGRLGVKAANHLIATNEAVGKYFETLDGREVFPEKEAQESASKEGDSAYQEGQKSSEYSVKDAKAILATLSEEQASEFLQGETRKTLLPNQPSEALSEDDLA